MSNDTRNPYIILGIPYGSNQKQALDGFAKAKRTLRDHPEKTENTIEDLTWALHQIEQIIVSPVATLDVYRIPANIKLVADNHPGIFNPPPHAATRQTQATDNTTLQQLQNAALKQAAQRYIAETTKRTTITTLYT